MRDHTVIGLHIDAVAKVDGALEHIGRDQIAGIPQDKILQRFHIGALYPIGIK
jgi:hypothetical protein